jgi:flagellar FliJ protein
LEGYKFKLQKLLDIREEKEEESKRYFREAQLEKERVESKLEELRGNYNKYRTASSNSNLVEQKLKQIYLNALNLSIVETTTELHEKNKVLDEKRNALKQRQIERKTVEILKEKQLEAFIKEQDLIEQKANDEFALYGFLRTREGGLKP